MMTVYTMDASSLINEMIAEMESLDNTGMLKQIERWPGKIIEARDEGGFSILHHAVLGCVQGKVAALISYVQELQGATDEQITWWANSRTNNDSFTPLHLASFKGNMDAILVLLEYGSDPQALNAFGLNMIHVAAQGDAAISLYYFKELGVDLNLQDQRGSTPLHWACYSNSEIALSYLLAWNPELNIQDQDGYTPLHLAVKSCDTVESTRPVRFLLIRGADKSIQDNSGQTPIDLVNAGEVATANLASDIKKMLVSSLLFTDTKENQVTNCFILLLLNAY